MSNSLGISRHNSSCLRKIRHLTEYATGGGHNHRNEKHKIFLTFAAYFHFLRLFLAAFQFITFWGSQLSAIFAGKTFFNLTISLTKWAWIFLCVVLSAINEESSTLPALLTDYILNGKNPLHSSYHRITFPSTAMHTCRPTFYFVHICSTFLSDVRSVFQFLLQVFYGGNPSLPARLTVVRSCLRSCWLVCWKRVHII